jgi:EPS-associated MarR family transcriptional regulator
MPESIPTSRQSKLQEDTNFRVLRLLQDNPNLSQRELAKALGISLGGVHYCLQALLDKGLIKIHNFQSSTRKLAYAYLLTPAGIVEKATLTGRFLKRKMTEYEQLRLEIESLQQESVAPAHHAKPQNGTPIQ